MKYNTINIYTRDNKWLWHIETRHEEREETDTAPSANGWYHFPETMSPAEAFKKLHSCMMRAHTKEIKRLEKSKAMLAGLKFSVGG